MIAVTPQVSCHLEIMEYNPTGAPRASSAVKDNSQVVMMTADEEKAAATMPTGDGKQDHDAKLETGPGQLVKLPERQRTVHGIKVLTSHFLQADPMVMPKQ
ncbi:putative mfs mdr transporter protein [Botrytis fragariae]|uniref:Putative mfs mdr transporter protein n=1 Tax=Botrytis fragariae TaxID=1964551 RepID=A0A8H6EML8_9HELO|nr:putative mfs mdr transporter protein [Botrytis fragariae]KAF5877455.1 putative mfs mdr transporter protein [Botrytis fragariae]